MPQKRAPVVCRWYTIESALSIGALPLLVDSADGLLRRLDSATPAGSAAARVCTNTLTGETTRALAAYGQRAAAPVITPAMLAQEASADLDVSVPTPATSPGLGHFQLVGLRTWLWVTDWVPVAETAAIPGLSATVTARPVRSTWDFGTAGRVVCDGAGTPYDFSRAAADQDTTCALTFTRSGTFNAQVTVEWAVSWQASTGAGGVLPAVARTTAFPIEVRAAQAVTD